MPFYLIIAAGIVDCGRKRPIIAIKKTNMSSETRPISPNSFAKAIEDLPLENIYSKAYEINNSVAQLEKSNKLLQEHSDSIKNDETLDADKRAIGDVDCLEAIRDNEVVIERQHARVRLLKTEVERRGQLWHEAEPKTEDVSNGHAAENGHADGGPPAASSSAQPARLTDDELRRQMEARLAEDDDGEEGMHL